jgi:hypothetical protein
MSSSSFAGARAGKPFVWDCYLRFDVQQIGEPVVPVVLLFLVAWLFWKY